MILENMIRKEVKEMPPSGIRKFFDIVNEMEDVISLGVGEPDFVTPWNIREAGIYSLEQGDCAGSSAAGGSGSVPLYFASSSTRRPWASSGVSLSASSPALLPASTSGAPTT